jgi:hypothetical protein
MITKSISKGKCVYPHVCALEQLKEWKKKHQMKVVEDILLDLFEGMIKAGPIKIF